MIEDTPALSLHAVAYPDGHTSPGEKKLVDVGENPSGKQDESGSIMTMPADEYMPEQDEGGVKVVVKALRGKEDRIGVEYVDVVMMAVVLQV